jgi:hypothetical protein
MDSILNNLGEMKKLLFILLMLSASAMGQIGIFRLNGDVTDALGINNLTASGSPTYTQGIKGNCMVLAGSQYATKSSPTGFPSGDANISASAWMYNTSSSAVSTMTSVGSAATRKSFGPTNYFNSNTSITCEVYGADVQTGANVSPINKWHYIVITHLGGGGNISASIKIYVDGVQIPIGTTSGDGTLNLAISELNVGRFIGNTYKWSGNLDEVTWYNTVLTIADVKNQYSSYKGFFQ